MIVCAPSWCFVVRERTTPPLFPFWGQVWNRDASMSFLSCPIASRFIETSEEARAYYAFRLVGQHAIHVRGVPLVVQFNPEETHLFTDERNPCPPGDVVRRAGRSGELRCFERTRARMMDRILPTIAGPVAAFRALIPGGVQLYGPPESSAPRVCVVVAPAGGARWFVRTAYPVTSDKFARARREGFVVPWPPK